MKKIAMMIILVTMAFSTQEGEKVLEIRKIDWMRINLTAMYNGYFCGDKNAYINIYSLAKDKNTLNVIVYIRKGSDAKYYMKQARRAFEAERTNMKAFWLNYNFIQKEL